MSQAQEIKQGVVTEIADKLQRAQSVVVVDYKGLTVEEVTDLRNKARAAGLDYKVYKNTLVRRAAQEVGGFDRFNDTDLVGANAFAFGYEDAVGPAKIMSDFAKGHAKLELKMGYVEGNFYDAATLVQLANIPSREELLAKLLGSFKSPIADFVRLMDAIAKSKEEGQGEAAAVAAE